MFVVFAFAVIVLLTGGGVLFRGSVSVGLAGTIGPLVCMVAGAGAKSSIVYRFWGSIPVAVILFLIGAVPLALTGYRVVLWGIEINGFQWGAVGALVGIVFVPANYALSRQRRRAQSDAGDDT